MGKNLKLFDLEVKPQAVLVALLLIDRWLEGSTFNIWLEALLLVGSLYFNRCKLEGFTFNRYMVGGFTFSRETLLLIDVW